MTMPRVYTVGNGNLVQFAQREDGVWFIRRAKCAGEHWHRWEKHGTDRPYAADVSVHATYPRSANLPRG